MAALAVALAALEVGHHFLGKDLAGLNGGLVIFSTAYSFRDMQKASTNPEKPVGTAHLMVLLQVYSTGTSIPWTERTRFATAHRSAAHGALRLSYSVEFDTLPPVTSRTFGRGAGPSTDLDIFSATPGEQWRSFPGEQRMQSRLAAMS